VADATRFYPADWRPQTRQRGWDSRPVAAQEGATAC
jgi:hypothetical protein